MSINNSGVITLNHDQYVKKQKFLQSKNYYNGLIDGAFGPLSKAAEDNWLRDLDRLMTNKSYIYYTRGKLNLIGERTSNKYTNKDTDWMYAIWTSKDSVRPQVLIVDCSTKPGLYGSGAIMNPKWISGMFGTASLVPGQYLDCWSFIDAKNSWWSRLWSGKPYMMQNLGMVTVARDGNKNLVLESNLKTQTGFFGINIHQWKGSWINNWSLACQVIHSSQMVGLINVWRYHSKLNGNKFSYTLIEYKDYN